MGQLAGLHRDLLEGEQHIQGLLDNGSEHLIHSLWREWEALHWLDRNFELVSAMYEDRHQLWGFNHQGRLIRRLLPARRAQVLWAF